MKNLYRSYIDEYFQDKSNKLGYMESWKIASSNEPEDFSNFQRFFVKRMSRGAEIGDLNEKYNECFETFKTFCEKIKDADDEDFEGKEIIERFATLKIAPFNDEEVFFEVYKKWIEQQLKQVQEATRIMYIETIHAYFESVIQKLTSRQDKNKKYNLARGILNFIIHREISTVFMDFQRFWLEQRAAIDVHTVKKMSAQKVGQKFEEYFQIWQEDVGKRIGIDLKPLNARKDAQEIFLTEYHKWRYEQTSPDAHAALVSLQREWTEWVSKEEKKPISLLVEVAERLKNQGAGKYEQYFRKIGATASETQNSDDNDSYYFPAFELHNSVFRPEFDEYINHMYVALLDDSGDAGSIKLLSDALTTNDELLIKAITTNDPPLIEELTTNDKLLKDFCQKKKEFMERVQRDWEIAVSEHFDSDEAFQSYLDNEMKKRLEEYDKMKKEFIASRGCQLLFLKYALSLKNKMAHQGRKAAKNVDLDEADKHGAQVNIFNNPEKIYIVKEFLNQFSDQEKKIVYLTIAGYTQREIGKNLGISASTVSRVLKKVGINPRKTTKKIPKKKTK